MLKEAKEMRDIAEDSAELKHNLELITARISESSLQGVTSFTFHAQVFLPNKKDDPFGFIHQERLHIELAKALRLKGYTVIVEGGYQLKISW